MAENEQQKGNQAVKETDFSGKLKGHFVFRSDSGPNILHCVHCKKQFSFRGSNSSLTYHLQHKHFDQYKLMEKRDKTASTIKQTKLTGFVQEKSKPVSKSLANDLKIALTKWIATSGRPVSIVDDEGLQEVLRIALQNDTYTLPSRRTIDSSLTSMYSVVILFVN
jgi:hypothetical protein